jgi:hypothetical protein
MARERYRRDLRGTRWYAGESELLPHWYPARSVVFSVLARAAIDRVVYDHWFVALRRFYLSDGRVVNNPVAASGFGVAIRIFDGLCLKRGLSMAQGRSIAVRGWVSLSLTKKDKDAIAASEVSVETMLQDLGALSYRGYRFSMTYDAYSDSVQSTLVCANEDDENCGAGMSARHPDPVLSLTTLMYKLGMLDGKCWHDFTSRPAPDSWA